MDWSIAIAVMSPLLLACLLLVRDVRKAERAAKESEAQTLRAIAVLNGMKSDAARWRWLADDVDGDAQDDFIRWLHGGVASREAVDAECDRMMDPRYRSPQAERRVEPVTPATEQR